jgi:ATP/ADP translocase
MENSKIRQWTGVVITVAWVAAVVSGIATHDYEGLTLITPIMLIYAGYVFGAHLIEKRLPVEEG